MSPRESGGSMLQDRTVIRGAVIKEKLSPADRLIQRAKARRANK